MRLQLAVCAAVLLSGLTPDASAQDEESEVSSDILLYTDTDQVLVFSPQVGIRHAVDEDGGEVSARVVVDAITAASVDVVSNATYRFSEVRTEVNLAGSKAFGDSLPSLNYRGSYEPDYVSHGFGGSWAQGLAGGDASVAASYTLVVDTIGRVDTPTNVFSETLMTHVFNWSGTQNIDTHTLVRLAYSFTGQFGYMEKPYRSVPLFDASGIASATDANQSLSLTNFDVYRLNSKPAEEVPDDRFRHAIALRGLHYWEKIEASLRLDYRLYGDSWGIWAHTVEMAIYRDLSDSWRAYGWTRLHRQSSADFWKKIYIVDSANTIPALRTTDRSLSSSTHATGGLRGEYHGDTTELYWELSAMYSSFDDFLYLSSRTAIISQGGARWAF